MTRRHAHPNQLTAIKPHQYKPGECGNLNGGVKKGDKWTILQWQAHFKNAETTVGELDAIIKNRVSEAAHKVSAAIQLRNCASTGTRHVVGKNGEIAVGTTDPEMGRERERLTDRQSGKPTVEIRVTRINQPSLADLRQAALETARLLGPVVVNRMIERMQEKAAKDHSIVDTTAEVLTAAKNTAAATVAPADEGDWSQEGFNRAARAAVESMREPEQPEPEQQGPGGWMRTYDPETGERNPVADPV